MKVQIKNELIIIGVLTLLYVALFPFFSSLVLGLIIGLPIIIFFPGYVIMAALFPKQHQLGGLERVGLSFGISIFLSPLVGVLYHFTPIGIQPYPILITLAAIIVGGGAFAWRQRRRLPEEERFTIAFNLGFLRWGRSALIDKALSIVLVVSIIAAIGAVGYSSAQPVAKEPFSELYILGLEGEAIDYPREVIVAEETAVIVGIANQELKEESYRLETWIDGKKNSEVGPLVLAQGEKWEEEVSFTPTERGENQKVEFLLFKGSETQPCTGPVYLWINAREIGEKFTLFHVTNYPTRPGVAALMLADLKIINHEGETVDYRVEVWMAGEKVPGGDEVILEAGETRETTVSLTPQQSGEQEMEFRLYKSEEDQPIRSVSFRVTVERTDFLVTSYPSRPELGSIHTVDFRIVNTEEEVVTYRVEMWFGGEKMPGEDEVTLEAGETKEMAVSLAVQRAGEHELEFRLYKSGEDQPIRSVSFRVTVGPPMLNVISYPTRPELGGIRTADVEITNYKYYEEEVVTYRVEVWMAGEKVPGGGEATLKAEETKAVTVLLTAQKAGEQEIEFRLYKSGEDQPIRSVTFMVTVVMPEE